MPSPKASSAVIVGAAETATVFACSSPSTTSAACAFLIASSVLVGSTARQLSVSLSASLLQVRLPGFRLDPRRRQLLELLDQQDQPQAVAEDEPFLLGQFAAGDERVEVAAVAQRFAGRPHGLRVEVADFGIQSRRTAAAAFSAKHRRPLVPRTNSSSSSSSSAFGGLASISPLANQFRVERFGGERAGRQIAHGTRTYFSSGRGISSTLSSA